jgi:hypothetical protein
VDKFDEALVERLAKVSYDSPAETEHGIEICPALVFEEASEDAKRYYRAEVRQFLTALSETHAIVPKAEYEAREVEFDVAVNMILRGTPYCSPKVEAQYCRGANGCVACLRQRISEKTKEASPHA